MSKQKLTPWFRSNVKPVHKGVYLTDASSRHHPMYQYWNGSFWGYFQRDKKNAMKFENDRSCYQSADWRGLASDPNA